MSKKYYLHRISYEGNASYTLLKEGYLTLGWSIFSDSGILDAARKEGYPDFDVITEKLGESHNRSRWSMWYFAQMNVGDIVVVPLYAGMFSVYEVCGMAKPIADLESLITSFEGEWNKHRIEWKNHKLYDADDKKAVDIGFFVKVKPIVENVPRKYVSGKLISRMKIRTTSADITDIGEFVESGIKAGKENKPVTLYDEVIDSLVDSMKSSILSALDPDKFEQLVKWYLEKCGASLAWIPSKNESGKSDGADADIVAEFDNLKYIVYVQVKWHEGETSDWAVYQIDSYKNQMSEGDSSYTYATWVISSADKFSEQAVTDAEEKGVRLINGSEFARMLLDIGLWDINNAFEFS